MAQACHRRSLECATYHYEEDDDDDEEEKDWYDQDQDQYRDQNGIWSPFFYTWVPWPFGSMAETKLARCWHWDVAYLGMV